MREGICLFLHALPMLQRQKMTMSKRAMRTLMKETGQLIYSWRAPVSQDQVRQGGMCRLVQPQQAL